jgi:Holliday junction resolvasome RuvABC ATP-dependent DNA helicase subunit
LGKVHPAEKAIERVISMKSSLLAPTTVVDKNVLGREKARSEEGIPLLFSENHQGKVVSALPIVGQGGLGKTTIARIVYNEKRVKDRFSLDGFLQ